VASEPPDTGDLRSDLVETFCGPAGVARPHNVDVLGVVVTALQTDPAFAQEFREKFLGPKVAAMQAVYRRAAERGELLPGVDPALLGPALAGIILHRSVVLGDPVTRTLVERVVDEIIVPAATGRHPSHQQEPS
jgi:hypothetical protein